MDPGERLGLAVFVRKYLRDFRARPELYSAGAHAVGAAEIYRESEPNKKKTPERQRRKAIEAPRARDEVMKKLILRFLSWCFPLQKLDAPWRAMLSLSIVRPLSRHWSVRRIVEDPFPTGCSNLLLALSLSLAITALGSVVIRLLLP
jgi:hypothetical protein